MSKLVVVLALLASVFVVSLSAGDKASPQSLCDNLAVSFDTLSEVKGLIQQVNNENIKGCDKYKDSLVDLEELLSLVEEGQTSSLDFTRKVENYHEKYIASESNEARDNIPTSLRQFFISLIFQISADFKIQLVNNLEVDTEEYVTEADYEIIKLLDRSGAILVDKDADISDFDDIVLLNDITKVAEAEESEDGPMKLMIKIKTSEALRKLIQTCRSKFNPIYEKLILPLISLSNMGYNYQGALLAVELEELRNNPLVRQWYNIVQVCETFKAIEIYEASDAFTDGDRQVFTFVTPEEAEQLRQSQGCVNDIVSSEKPIEYNPEAFHRDDLWIKDQNELNRLLKNYKASSNEADRIRRLVLRKLMSRLKDSIKSGKLLLNASQFMRENLRKDEDNSSVSEDIISLMDKAIEDSEETVQVNKLDGSVAGKEPVRIPKRAGFIKKKPEDHTKLIRKLQRLGFKGFLPSRMGLSTWYISLAAVLLTIILCALIASG